MPNLAAHSTLANDGEFRRRVQAAITQRAVTGAEEPKPADTATDAQLRRWNERRTFSRQVLASPTAYVERFAWLVAGDAALLASFTSAQVGSNVAQLPDAVVDTAVDTSWQVQVRATRTDDVPAPPAP